MTHDPKLEIYKLKLLKKENGSPVTFREFFRKKFSYYREKKEAEITEGDIFKSYYDDFIKKIDSEGYKVNIKKKKAFTIAFEEADGKRQSHISSPLSKDMIISGTFEGGKHGIKRWLGEVEDKTKKTQISTKHIVGDRFYFLIYTPLDHSEAIVMIQGYTEIKISDVVREYLVDYFKHLKEIESKFEIFIPQSLKDKYLEKATFNSLRFSTGWNIRPDFEDLKHKDYDIQINIEIIDKSNKKSNYKKAIEFLKAFGKSKFTPEGGIEKKLEEFEKKNAKMKSGDKTLPIDFDNDYNIKPVILLKDQGIDVAEDGIPSFEQINSYCREMLKEIKKEVMPTHAIKEL